MNAAGIILAGGAGQIRSVFWDALAVAVLAIAAGVFFVLLFRGIARWQAIRGEQMHDPGPDHPARRGLPADDTIAEFGHDLDKEIEETLKGDGR